MESNPVPPQRVLAQRGQVPHHNTQPKMTCRTTEESHAEYAGPHKWTLTNSVVARKNSNKKAR